MYNTVEQIKAAFVKDGWSSSIEFSELTMQEAKEIGCYSIMCDMERGKKFFRMAVTGNIFDNRGEIVIYNIPAIRES